ncbi:hypothetical protein, partial [Vibrio parahaemolyticus]|uniref:hypothetical protein n=1 Tax=Vibrio parahaemolyticus TaxID=670 RepID=UPI001E3D65C2
MRKFQLSFVTNACELVIKLLVELNHAVIASTLTLLSTLTWILLSLTVPSGATSSKVTVTVFGS